MPRSIPGKVGGSKADDILGAMAAVEAQLRALDEKGMQLTQRPGPHTTESLRDNGTVALRKTIRWTVRLKSRYTQSARTCLHGVGRTWGL